MAREENHLLFTPHELLHFQAIVNHHLVEAEQTIPLLISALLALVGVAAVGIVEWELVYRVFDYLAGEANNYWSPKLMASSSAIVMVGFHLLAKANPDNPAVRLVDSIIGILIPVYLLGIGLLIASMLYADGLGSIAATPPSLNLDGPSIGAPPETISGHWLDALFSSLTQPLSVLTFSLGIGGLAICNIFVTHRLLTTAERNAGSAHARWRKARNALSDYRVVKHMQQRHAELNRELAELDQLWDVQRIRELITSEVLGVIAENLLPHKTRLTERKLHTVSRFERSDGIDPRAVADQITRIEAITGAQVMAVLNRH